MEGQSDVQILSFRRSVAIFDSVSVGFDFRLNSVLLVAMVSVTNAKMVVKGRVMARSLSSVIMFVRNIVCL